MLFLKNGTDSPATDDVSAEEWQTLMSHAVKDRVEVARRLRGGMSTATLEALDRARTINLRLLTDTGVMTAQDWEQAKRDGVTDPALSQVLVRYLRVQAAANEMFGGVQAEQWLQSPNRALDGETPVSLLDTDDGFSAVDALLVQIGHGIAS